MNQLIRYENQGAVDVITLSDTSNNNAFTLASLHGLAEIFEKIELESSAQVVLIKAEGNVFSSGGDVNHFKNILETKEPISMEISLAPGPMVQAIRNCSKPVVCCVQGPAAGAGMGVALASDYLIMGESGKLVPAFNDIGLSGDSGVLYFLGKNIGPKRTFEIMTTKRFIKAEEALELGLANQVVPDDKLDVKTEKFVKTLVNKPSKILARQKSMINDFFYPDLKQFNYVEAVGIHTASQEPAFIEAVSSFFDKRRADFKDK